MALACPRPLAVVAATRAAMRSPRTRALAMARAHHAATPLQPLQPAQAQALRPRWHWPTTTTTITHPPLLLRSPVPLRPLLPAMYKGMGMGTVTGRLPSSPSPSPSQS